MCTMAAMPASPNQHDTPPTSNARELVAKRLQREKCVFVVAALGTVVGVAGVVSNASMCVHDRAAIEKIKAENAVLERELALESRQTKLITSSYAQRMISELHDSGDAWTRRIEQQKRNISVRRRTTGWGLAHTHALNDSVCWANAGAGITSAGCLIKAIPPAAASGWFARVQTEQPGWTGRVFRAELVSLRVGIACFVQMIAKQIRILENRLNNALKKFNQTLQTNRELRAKVDDHRRERGGQPSHATAPCTHQKLTVLTRILSRI